ncbi:MAG: hypothetical protein FJZ87_01545 [Chloroflexi bacterium]|nr:hypothetical protein [Chloroflexota bacterium]
MQFPRYRVLPPTSRLILVVTLLNMPPLHGAVRLLQQTKDALTLEGAKIVVDYGKTVTFTARFEATFPTEHVTILLKGHNEDTLHVEEIPVNADGTIEFIYNAEHDPLPPFGTMLIQARVDLEGGRMLISEPIPFAYNDSRFPWQTISQDDLNMHWYAGEASFAAEALKAAVSGLESIRSFFPITSTEPIHIYVYSNPVDLQDALAMGGETWAAGHTPPGLDAILAAIEPGPNQSFEMNTEIPHELAHWVLFRTLREGYHRQPVWLLEGMASMAELDTPPDHASALQAAHRTGTLLPFTDLCASFPTDAGGAFLAYAQSRSFVTYIRKTYGDAVLLRLTRAYHNRGILDGTSCAVGTIEALGMPLGQLDENWRKSLALQEYDPNEVHNLAPFIAVMALILIVPLWGLLEQTSKRRNHGRGPT